MKILTYIFLDFIFDQKWITLTAIGSVLHLHLK